MKHISYIIYISLFLNFSFANTNNVINRVIAVVNDQVITLTDLYLFNEIKKIIQGDKNVNMDVIKITEKLIITELLYQESKKYNIASMSTKEAINMLNGYLKQTKSTPKFIKKLNLTLEDLLPILIRIETTTKFINEKIVRDNILISEQEITNYLHNKNIKKTTKNKKTAIKFLQNLKNEQLLQNFVEKLFERNRVKYIVSNI